MCPYFHFPVDDGLLCYISRGYQSLEELNLNKENREYSKICRSKESACFAFTGQSLKRNKKSCYIQVKFTTYFTPTLYALTIEKRKKVILL